MVRTYTDSKRYEIDVEPGEYATDEALIEAINFGDVESTEVDGGHIELEPAE